MIPLDAYGAAAGDRINRVVVGSGAPVTVVVAPDVRVDPAPLLAVAAVAAAVPSGIAAACPTVSGRGLADEGSSTPGVLGVACFDEQVVGHRPGDSDTPEWKAPHEASAVIPSLVAFRRDRFLDLGGMHPDLGRVAGMVDLCMRSGHAGHAPIVCPTARISTDSSGLLMAAWEMDHLLLRWRHRLQWDAFVRRGRVGSVNPDVLPENAYEGRPASPEPATRLPWTTSGPT